MIRRTHLFIDKLSETISVNPSHHGQVKRGMDELCLDNMLVEVTDRYSELLKGYRHAYKLFFDETNFCAFQIHPRKSGHRYMRIEWNPTEANKACVDAMERIASVLSHCIPGGSVNLILEGHITRIDLSFDLFGANMHDFSVSAMLRRNQSGKYEQLHETYTHAGKINSRYLGKADSNKYLLIYDKWAERESPQFAGNKPRRNEVYEGRYRRARPLSWIRFELTLRQVGSWDSLFDSPNPFNRYLVAQHECIPSALRGHEGVFFAAACEKFGTQAALSLIEDTKLRNRYAKALRQAGPPGWWKQEEIWNELGGAFRAAMAVEGSECSH